MGLGVLLENQLVHWQKNARSCIYSLFLPQGVAVELILALWAAVSKIRADFQNCHIWAWNLPIGQSSHWPKFQKLHIYISPPLIRTSLLPKNVSLLERYSLVRENTTFIYSTCCQKFVSFLARCPFYRVSCKRGTRVHSFYSQGFEIELIFALWAAVFEIRAYIQNSHIWAWNLAIGQSSRTCTFGLFLPQGVEIELIFDAQAAAKQTEQFCYLN